ncbi:septum site-determining protein MinC [bacterium endosymbiont of Pedicinus badii]|uniref:septum site-determining protein MinC n=1 Tax=bacterium endosymbiont of Pedicinus badii TaxID=1719126 RepID=UPI0009BAF95B|nr:septum site-determining protein MinC [bacterium endosymbiont of Pedicinus badii]OQM34414.1 hypothetical protein AOQ89_00805 [bacterium endosymbiont of Pedicinus badii]
MQIKVRNFSFFVIYVYEKDVNKLQKKIFHFLEKNPIFLKNIPIIVNFKNTKKNFPKKLFLKIITKMGLNVVGVTKKKIKKENFVRANFSMKKNNFLSKKQKSFKVIQRTIRSGQKIYERKKDLIVLSNINSGAEIISDYNIYIYGTLRGKALAGFSGNKECQIFCTKSIPEMLSIAGKCCFYEDIPKNLIKKSVRFFLLNNRICMQKILV